ncbi:MAG: hypothetical protein NT161_02195 [Candidatus Nomurabacteria bacterium]|nr:hypothetical protein [Candidatus Nomurabacteria bacterium]
MYNIIKMIDKKSKIFFGIFFSLIAISVVLIYYRYMVIKDIVFLTDEKAFNQSLLEGQ